MTVQSTSSSVLCVVAGRRRIGLGVEAHHDPDQQPEHEQADRRDDPEHEIVQADDPGHAVARQRPADPAATAPGCAWATASEAIPNSAIAATKPVSVSAPNLRIIQRPSHKQMARLHGRYRPVPHDENQFQGDLGGPPNPSHCDLMPRRFCPPQPPKRNSVRRVVTGRTEDSYISDGRRPVRE